jgi:hypothetical protein
MYEKMDAELRLLGQLIFWTSLTYRLEERGAVLGVSAPRQHDSRIGIRDRDSQIS